MAPKWYGNCICFDVLCSATMLYYSSCDIYALNWRYVVLQWRNRGVSGAIVAVQWRRNSDLFPNAIPLDIIILGQTILCNTLIKS